MKPITPYQFTLFRVILGCYLVFHFATLLPYAPEMLSATGMVADPHLLPTFGLFPNPLYYFDSPLMTQVGIASLIVIAFAFTWGFYPRIAAVLLWFGWACLFNRNILIANPGMPFIGWLLLACALIPPKKEGWQMPPLLYGGAWALMALGYTISGIHKLGSESWLDGTALQHVLEGPLSRANIVCDTFLALPPICIHIFTWGALLLEVLFAPLCLLPATRKWAWLCMVLMHLGILTMVNFADLTVGVLMIHLFTFDARWITPLPTGEQSPIVFFDGVCAMCNGFVQFVFQESLVSTLSFSPLQGATAQQTLPVSHTKDVSSIVLYDNGAIYTESDAIIRICRYMGGLWGLAVVLYAIPPFIRNAVYRFIAARRYRWFGKRTEVCRLPAMHERQFLLP